ncbi:thioredoxin family protein [Qipengyuania marisflavi]|uniref:Thioredoxin family protein n=1 Tax=Qipengyuania marisflavi TaxID=2486356 RepID=A0A5S3NZ86_9SPHN|nr:thioredoxin family protein [Qipengyuania marisflavi]TMM45840.1 thioredoxin family protein [Qipengyuania marisflavi]
MRHLTLPAALVVATSLLGGCAAADQRVAQTAAPAHPEARSYDAASDASADVDAALARAAQSGRNVLIVMGGNWCHDSRALAGWLETPRFAALVEQNFDLVFVNIGMPQTGDGHNLEIARRYGLEELPGTPNLLVVAPDGTLLNPDTATSWRNAASRSEDAIFTELQSFAQVAQ